MVIIIEGADGSGKSTLAEQLARRFNAVIRHEGPPPATVRNTTDVLTYYGLLLEAARDTDTIFDRFALGERVYGPLLRNHDLFGDDGWREFTRLITAVGAVQVLCTPPYQVCHESWSSGRAELFRDEALLRRSYDAFSSFFFGQQIYDYTRVGAFRKLCSELEVPRPSLPAGMTGSPRARYLFVGDRGSNPTAPLQLPFFSTLGASAYLHAALNEAGYTDDTVAFINAYDGDNEPNIIPQFRTVIALGQRAALACRRQRVQCSSIEHPQYWRRFYYHQRASYAARLRELRRHTWLVIRSPKFGRNYYVTCLSTDNS